MCSFHAQNRRHHLLAYVRIILSQVRIDGCCVRVAKVTRDRARSLRLLPNPHRRGMANSVAMDHVLVQPSQPRVPHVRNHAQSTLVGARPLKDALSVPRSPVLHDD
jgi:hypothetical protein